MNCLIQARLNIQDCEISLVSLVQSVTCSGHQPCNRINSFVKCNRPFTNRPMVVRCSRLFALAASTGAMRLLIRSELITRKTRYPQHSMVETVGYLSLEVTLPNPQPSQALICSVSLRWYLDFLVCIIGEVVAIVKREAIIICPPPVLKTIEATPWLE